MNPTHFKFQNSKSGQELLGMLFFKSTKERAEHLRTRGFIPCRDKRIVSTVKRLDRLWGYWGAISPKEGEGLGITVLKMIRSAFCTPLKWLSYSLL
jgi:hypothetical protein